MPKKLGSGVVKVCAQAEAELSELEAEERIEFLQDLGIDEPGLDKPARATYALLGLQTYFTAGEKEIRVNHQRRIQSTTSRRRDPYRL